MDLTHLSQLSMMVSDFAHRENWQMKARPVICWEFDKMSDYFHALSDLQRMIHSIPYQYSSPTQASAERKISPDTCELDCMGVTFRLTCLERMATEYGERGVTGIDPVRFDFDALQALRKSSGY